MYMKYVSTFESFNESSSTYEKWREVYRKMHADCVKHAKEYNLQSWYPVPGGYEEGKKVGYDLPNDALFLTYQYVCDHYPEDTELINFAKQRAMRS